MMLVTDNYRVTSTHDVRFFFVFCKEYIYIYKCSFENNIKHILTDIPACCDSMSYVSFIVVKFFAHGVGVLVEEDNIATYIICIYIYIVIDYYTKRVKLEACIDHDR